jgi:hypothetical protein
MMMFFKFCWRTSTLDYAKEEKEAFASQGDKALAAGNGEPFTYEELRDYRASHIISFSLSSASALAFFADIKSSRLSAPRGHPLIG